MNKYTLTRNAPSRTTPSCTNLSVILLGVRTLLPLGEDVLGDAELAGVVRGHVEGADGVCLTLLETEGVSTSQVASEVVRVGVVSLARRALAPRVVAHLTGELAVEEALKLRSGTRAEEGKDGEDGVHEIDPYAVWLGLIPCRYLK